MATGTRSFVGGTSVEGKITDANTGDVLVQMVDAGGKKVPKGIYKYMERCGAGICVLGRTTPPETSRIAYREIILV